MKRIITFLISISIMLSFSITSYADNVAIVSADDVPSSSLEQVLIPVKISNNSGIMGFKMTVQYSADLIDINNVTRGEVTSVGNFNTNLGTSDGKFDIIWNNTSDVKTNGTLFVLSVKLKKEIKSNTEIKLSFSQPDTFNESWQDVVLNCKNIKVTATNDNATENSSQEVTNNSNNTDASQSTDSSQIKDAVDITLDQNNVNNLSQVTDKDKFLEDFNNNIETITGNDKNNVDSFEEIEKIYKDSYEKEFVKEVINNIDEYKIKSIVSETLKDYNVDSIDDLNDADKQQFIVSVEEKLKAEDSDVSNISNDLDVDNALQIIDKIYNDSSNETKKHDKTILIVIGALFAIITVGLFSVIVIRNRKR